MRCWTALPTLKRAGWASRACWRPAYSLRQAEGEILTGRSINQSQMEKLMPSKRTGMTARDPYTATRPSIEEKKGLIENVEAAWRWRIIDKQLRRDLVDGWEIPEGKAYKKEEKPLERASNTRASPTSVRTLSNAFVKSSFIVFWIIYHIANRKRVIALRFKNYLRILGLRNETRKVREDFLC